MGAKRSVQIADHRLEAIVDKPCGDLVVVDGVAVGEQSVDGIFGRVFAARSFGSDLWKEGEIELEVSFGHVALDTQQTLYILHSL